MKNICVIGALGKLDSYCILCYAIKATGKNL